MKTILETIQSLEEDLQFFSTLTEDQACELYNVDYKTEAREHII